MNADSSEHRSSDTKKLLDYGFSKVKSHKLYKEDTLISTVKLDKSKNGYVDLYNIEDINLIYEGSLDESSINKQIILNENFIAPIKKGDIVGQLIITYNNQNYKYPLIVKENIESLNILELIWKYLLEILF